MYVDSCEATAAKENGMRTEFDDGLALLDALLKVDVSEVLQLCTNADPNYGALWFHSKQRSLDTAAQVILDFLNSYK